jgi:hypothetical protein
MRGLGVTALLAAALLLVPPANAARLSRADRAAIDRTIDAFVATAVRHRNVAAAYDLVTPAFRGGMTRAEWAKGDIPVYPYPARGTSWHGWTVDYVLKNDVAFELVLQPRRGSKADPISFSGEVKKRGGRWLVDSFYPAAIYVTKESRVIGPRDFAPGGVANDAGESRLGPIWFAVPAAIGGLIVLVPIAFALRGWYHRRKARALLSPEDRARDEQFWERLRSRSSESA